jgi:hypothetical protein
MAKDHKPSSSEQGEVSEPERIAGRGRRRLQEQPTERQQEREQAIVDDPSRSPSSASPRRPGLATADSPTTVPIRTRTPETTTPASSRRSRAPT